MKTCATALIGVFLLTGSLLALDTGQGASPPELQKEVVKVNYIDARSARGILMPYLSRNGKIQMVQETNMLIIEDIPEIVDKILSILKEIDVKPHDLQFTVDLILGSKTGAEESSSGWDMPPERLRADPLLRELRRLLTYETFKMLDSTLIKVQDNTRSTHRLGGEGLSFRLDLYPRYIREEGTEAIRVQLRLTKDSYKKDGSLYSLTLIDTSISLKSGDRSVVGVSKLNGGDTGLILILSGKVLE